MQVDDDARWALTLANAEGAVLASLRTARLSTRVRLLDSVTVVRDYQRRFAAGSGVRKVADVEREGVLEAFGRYLGTIPESKRADARVAYDVIDVAGKSGFGIGSAGLPAYTIMIEGYSQSLDNDVVLTMKQGNIAAASRVVDEGGSPIPTPTGYGGTTSCSSRPSAPVPCIR